MTVGVLRNFRSSRNVASQVCSSTCKCVHFTRQPWGAGGWGGKHTLTRAHMQIKAINSLWWSETSRRKQSVPLPWKPLSPRRAERDGKTQRADEMGGSDGKTVTDRHIDISWKGRWSVDVWRLAQDGWTLCRPSAAAAGGKFANYRSSVNEAQCFLLQKEMQQMAFLFLGSNLYILHKYLPRTASVVRQGHSKDQAGCDIRLMAERIVWF